MVKHPDLPDVARPDRRRTRTSGTSPGCTRSSSSWRQAGGGATTGSSPWWGRSGFRPRRRRATSGRGELTQVFYFDLLQQPFEAGAFRASLTQTLDGVSALPGGAGVPTWALNSHDVHRSVSRYGLVEPEPMRSVDLNATRTRARGRVTSLSAQPAPVPLSC